MPDPAHQLQWEEVVAKASASPDRSCAVVHVGSRIEATVFADGKQWAVRAALPAAPTDAALRRLRPMRLKHTVRAIKMSFGPRRGETVEVHEVGGRFKEVAPAASAALALVRALAAVPDTEWLWVTDSAYDDRGEPPAR